MKRIIVYHSNCVDGFTAAWLVHRTLGGGEMIGVQYDLAGREAVREAMMGMGEGVDFWMVDYSVGNIFMHSLSCLVESLGGKLTVCDHHKTALAELSGWGRTSGFYLVNGICGAELTCRALGVEVSELVRYVGDRDLWKWELPASRDVSAYIGTLDKTLEEWDKLAGEWNVERYAMEGKGVLRGVEAAVRRAVQGVREGKIGEWSVGAVIGSGVTSEVGEKLNKDGWDIAAMMSVGWNGEVICSLRSKNVDIGAIAERFGGGGHAAAAGCTFANLEEARNAFGLAAAVSTEGNAQ